MEILVSIVSCAFILGLIVSPFLILKILSGHSSRCKLLIYLMLGVGATLTLALIFGWWTDTANQILLSHYGYDFNAMHDFKRFVNVPAENLERVKSLEISMMGIGWPLRAFMTYQVYSPYLFVGYLLVYTFKNYKKGKDRSAKNAYYEQDNVRSDSVLEDSDSR